MKFKVFLCTLALLTSTNSFSLNYSKLNDGSDSIAERISNRLVVPSEMIQNSMDFLEETDTQQIKQFSTLPQMSEVSSREYGDFYKQCEDTFQLFTGVPLIQAEVCMIVERVNKNLETRQTSSPSTSLRSKEDSDPKTRSSSNNSSKLREVIPGQKEFDALSLESLDMIIERANQAKSKK